jgi:hypothetical protein
MTNVDPTRPHSGCIAPGGRDTANLTEGGDPYECRACLAAGIECDFHRGWAAGWDAYAVFVARVVEDERAAELAIEPGDAEGVV